MVGFSRSSEAEVMLPALTWNEASTWAWSP